MDQKSAIEDQIPTKDTRHVRQKLVKRFNIIKFDNR